ncbi:MAG: iron-containing alcohol dehydrogenase [Chloroflexi bacterium]|nr:iron-containing alcohol dehydrogenase [Chloroflexota bacterium]
MFNYTIQSQRILFAPGALDQIGAAAAQLGLKRLLLITSPSLAKGGQVERLAAALQPHLLATFSRTEAHVQDYQLVEVLALAQEHQIDGIIGMGGGSPIGLAKALSLAWESRLSGVDEVRSTTPLDVPLIPVIAMPTTYAGSEMTPVYGITHHLADGSSRKITVRDPKIAPRIVIYDPEITLTLPPSQTAGTGMNALAHCFEALYSVTKNPLSSAAALAGLHAIHHALPTCLQNGADLEARIEMLLGAHLAGTSLATVDMALHHGLCHVLGGTVGVAHGVANTIMLSHVLRFNQVAAATELAQAAEAMGVRGVAAAIEQVEWLASQTGLPRRLRDVGVGAEMLPRLAEIAMSSATVHKTPRPITSVTEIEEIFAAAW